MHTMVREAKKLDETMHTMLYITTSIHRSNFNKKHGRVVKNFGRLLMHIENSKQTEPSTPGFLGVAEDQKT